MKNQKCVCLYLLGSARPEEIECCYIHNVSPIKVQGNGGKNYFDCQIQTQDKQIHGVCFELGCRNEFKSIESNRSPVKLKNFRLSNKFNTENIVMDDQTHVTLTQNPEEFLPINMTEATPLSQFPLIAVEQLLTIKAKVVQMSGIKLETYTENKKQLLLTILEVLK